MAYIVQSYRNSVQMCRCSKCVTNLEIDKTNLRAYCTNIAKFICKTIQVDLNLILIHLNSTVLSVISISFIEFHEIRSDRMGYDQMTSVITK